MSQSQLDRVRHQNLAVIANLTDLAAGIVSEVAGNEISNRLNGEMVTGSSLRELVVAKVRTTLAQQTGGA